MVIISIITPIILFLIISSALFFLQGDLYRIIFTIICFFGAITLSLLGNTWLAMIIAFSPIATLFLPKTERPFTSAQQIIQAAICSIIIFLVLWTMIPEAIGFERYALALLAASIFNIMLATNSIRLGLSIASFGISAALLSPSSTGKAIIIFTTLVFVAAKLFIWEKI